MEGGGGTWPAALVFFFFFISKRIFYKTSNERGENPGPENN